MATWVTHLMIADKVLEQLPNLCRHEFCVGNIAPDCNIENEDWTSFTPSREVTHWMSGERKVASDCDRFLYEYMAKKTVSSVQEESFLLGYYAHLITDAEFQRCIRDEERVQNAWKRIRQHPELNRKAAGMAETWDSVKLLIPGKERMKDIFWLERDYLPHGAIVRKAKIMRRLPEKSDRLYPDIAMSVEEYESFVANAANLVTDAILRYRK